MVIQMDSYYDTPGSANDALGRFRIFERARVLGHWI